VLLHITHAAPQRDWILCADVFVADEYLTALRINKAIEAAQQCRLAGAAFSHESCCRARRDVDADAIERDNVAETVGYVTRSESTRHS